MNQRELKKIIGKKIVALDMRGQMDNGRKIYDPLFTLEDGTKISFVVQETNDGAYYGVKIAIHGKRKTKEAEAPPPQIASSRKIARLTLEEDRAMNKAWQLHMSNHKTVAEADRLAWEDICQEFPRLKEFDGAK
jgi:hypothetical protein